MARPGTCSPAESRHAGRGRRGGSPSESQRFQASSGTFLRRERPPRLGFCGQQHVPACQVAWADNISDRRVPRPDGPVVRDLEVCACVVHQGFLDSLQLGRTRSVYGRISRQFIAAGLFSCGLAGVVDAVRVRSRFPGKPIAFDSPCFHVKVPGKGMVIAGVDVVP